MDDIARRLRDGEAGLLMPRPEVVSAYDLSQTGHLRGKVVLRVR